MLKDLALVSEQREANGEGANRPRRIAASSPMVPGGAGRPHAAPGGSTSAPSDRVAETDRVRAGLGGSEVRVRRFDAFRLDPIDQCLWRDGVRIELTPKAFGVLRYLVEHAGRLVTQQELLEALWPETYVQPEILKTYIRDIRKILGDDPRAPRFIQTRARRGYRFIAPVSDESLLPAVPAAAAPRTSMGWVDAFQRPALTQAPLWMAVGQNPPASATGEPWYPFLDAPGQWKRLPRGATVVQTPAPPAPAWFIPLPALITPAQREALQQELLDVTREWMARELGADARGPVAGRATHLRPTAGRRTRRPGGNRDREWNPSEPSRHLTHHK
jgi:DNA-binding winged helix-turn-helix (wHTH) protein